MFRRLALLPLCISLAAAGPVTAAPVARATIGALVRSTPALAVGPGRAGMSEVRVRASGTSGLLALAQRPPRARLANGQWVSVLELAEGGSGGAFGAIVFAWNGDRPRYAGAIEAPDGRLEAAVQGGRIVVRRPLLDSSASADCCPSRWSVTRYAVRAGKLVATGRETVPGR